MERLESLHSTRSVGGHGAQSTNLVLVWDTFEYPEYVREYTYVRVVLLPLTAIGISHRFRAVC
jgi:hypothetical protein